MKENLLLSIKIPKESLLKSAGARSYSSKWYEKKKKNENGKRKNRERKRERETKDKEAEGRQEGRVGYQREKQRSRRHADSKRS